MTPRIALSRPPSNKDELWHLVSALWGVKLPRVTVCDGHVSPFDAFAEGYFGNDANWVLWYGSRGTGKSYMLALLGLTKAITHEINVTLLGGSMAQSQNVHEHVESLLAYPGAPRHVIAQMIQTQILFNGGNWIRPLPASQKTVRGPHPQMTLLDEIDEMERKIYDAAMGQAMTKPNARGVVVPEMLVASSTWQNPAGTFQSVMDEANKKGLPVRTWCYKETLAPNGWMDPEFIERKRRSVPAEMFRVEYELGEPAGGSRAFDLGRLSDAFVDLHVAEETHSSGFDEWVFDKPRTDATYAAGADWAKEADKTVIAVVRTDLHPREMVYLCRMNRRPWPEMIERFNKVTRDYQAVSAHDGTGIGNVVNDMIDERTMKVVMVGRDRTRLLTDYITAVEQGKYRLPRNTPSYDQHRSATVEDVYSPGTSYKAHLPDDVAAFAIMHRAAQRQAPPAMGQGVAKTDFDPKQFQPINAKPVLDQTVVSDGVVLMQEPAEDVGVFWLP